MIIPSIAVMEFDTPEGGWKYVGKIEVNGTSYTNTLVIDAPNWERFKSDKKFALHMRKQIVHELVDSYMNMESVEDVMDTPQAEAGPGELTTGAVDKSS